MMTAANPEQVIRDYLAAPHVVTSSRVDPPGSGWTAETGTGGMGALPETLTFVRMRALGARRLYAVTFEDTSGRRMFFVCHLVLDERSGAWRFDGGAGGSETGNPQRGQPWVNLGGGGWPSRFYAGGPLLEDDVGVVARVRLRAANGVTIEDTVDRGIALFLTYSAVALPIRAELLDSAGALVSQHDWLR
ncbi:MAG: hypothetical protein ACRDHE_08070 [Ktedonobacterales bacterium]